MRACISIDISKGKSYYQGFKNSEEAYTKAKPIQHDKTGFEEMAMIGKELKELCGEVTYVFEATGIYHRNLQQYLEEQGERYVIVNPLEAAKIRRSKLRSTKTDAKDCESIAKAYYTRKYEPHSKRSETYLQLQTMNRQYVYLVQILRQIKVRFRTILDIVYPKWDEIYANPYTEISLSLLGHYKHPGLIAKHKEESIARQLGKVTVFRTEACLNEARKVQAYANRTISGCAFESYESRMLGDMVIQLKAQQKQTEQCLEDMKGLIRNDQFYEQIKTIPGIGEILAIRLIAEMGNLSRFPSARQLVAYAGIDPIVYQSGKKDGEHLSITKKGNKNLRTLLYLAVASNIRNKTTNSILDFYNKKRQQATPMVYRAAVIACANKLLRIIYSMYRSGENFKF